MSLSHELESPRKLTDVALGIQTVPEISDFIDLPLTGLLPSYLGKGTLYRNGPGRYEITHSDGKIRHVPHWFDGYALLHQFAIDAVNNKVSYRSKFQSNGYIRSLESIPYDEYQEYTFGPSRKNLLGKMSQMWTKSLVDPVTGKPPFPNVNVTVQQIPEKGTVLRTDANLNLKLDEDALEASEFFTFDAIHPSLKGNMSAAHGHYDAVKGEFINYTYEIGADNVAEYFVFRVKSNGNVQVLASFKDVPVYMHSFATTDKYVILCMWPAEVDGSKMITHRSYMDAIEFNKENNTKFVVVSREECCVVATYESDPFYCSHTINAFDTEDGICIDLCRFEDISVLEDLMVENLRYNETCPELNVTRYSLENLTYAIMNGHEVTLKASEKCLSECKLEFPRIHPRLIRKDYRYVYGVDCDEKVFARLTKLDVKTGERLSWGIDRGLKGEPIFVPDPDGRNEDDGCILVVVLDASKEKSCMYILEAKSMSEIARAEVPQIVPLGFHGAFTNVSG